MDEEMNKNIKSILKESPAIIQGMKDSGMSHLEKRTTLLVESLIFSLGVQKGHIDKLTQFIDENF